MNVTREQFYAQLVYYYYFQQLYNDNSIILSIIRNDKTKMDEYLTKYLQMTITINEYLDAYDAAVDQTAKDAVVASVNYSVYSSDPVDPETAIFWPGSGGRFGDVKSP